MIIVIITSIIIMIIIIIIIITITSIMIYYSAILAQRHFWFINSSRVSPFVASSCHVEAIFRVDCEEEDAE